MTDLNYSFRLNETSDNESTSVEAWSFCGVKILAGPGNTALLYKTRTGQRMMVQPDLAQALQQCTAFKTLDAHAQRIVELIPALKEHPQNVKDTLETVRDKGLLESARETWERLTASADSIDTTSKSCRLFVLTCDRPNALRRLMENLQDSHLPSQIEGVWIIDDSRDENSIAANAEIIKASRSNISAPTTHFHLTARSALIAELIKHHPENEHAIRFLLDRQYWRHSATYGLGRNLALLLSGGRRALVMDDDIILKAMQPPLQKRPLRFGTPNDREAVFYSSADELDKHAGIEEQEPLSELLGSLGARLKPTINASWSGPQDLTNADGEAISRFSATSRILLTQCGVWGDVGSASGNWLFYTPATTQKRLLSSSHDIEKSLDTPTHWHGYRGTTLTPYGVMSALTGLDHNALLPPYFPAGRNEDILFGIMTQRLHPDSVVMNTEWAITHSPVDDRKGRVQLNPLEPAVDISLLADWLGREPEDQWGLPPLQRLSGLADQIERLTVMVESDLEKLISQMLLSKRSALLTRCLEQITELNANGLDGLPGTDRWREFLQESREKLLEVIQATEAAPLADMLTQRAEAGSTTDIDALRIIGRDFAAALRVWPALVGTASTLVNQSTE